MRDNMQSGDPITTLFHHHLWANLRLLERCATERKDGERFSDHTRRLWASER